MEGGTSGTKVIDAKGVAKSFGDKQVIRDFTLRIHRGDRIGIVGPNGAGKTTLLKLLTGALEPDAGNVKLGTGAGNGQAGPEPGRPASGRQSGQCADRRRQRHCLCRRQAAPCGELYAGFSVHRPPRRARRSRCLSGGERARLLLAKLFALPSNFLVLDEPTNDLDLETLDLLEETVGDYPGTALVVSHDRDFLDRVATMIVMAEGDGRFAVYAGGYSDMVAQRGQGVAKPEPKAGEKKAAAPKPRPGRDTVRQIVVFRPACASAPCRTRSKRRTGKSPRLQATLSDPRLYASDPAKFTMLVGAIERNTGRPGRQ